MPDQSKRGRFIGAGGIGSLGGGVVAVIAGLLLRQHFGPLKQVCDSGIGQLSQGVSGEAARHCGLDSFLDTVGTIALVCGIIVVVGTVLIGALLVKGGAPASSSPEPAQAIEPTRSSGAEQIQAVVARFVDRWRAVWPRLVRSSLIALAALGLVIAGYMSYQHFSFTSSLPHVACIGDCDRVPNSNYSELVGVPVALIGLVGYAAILGSLLVVQTEAARRRTAALSGIGLLFSVYLTYRELVTVQQVCPLCLCSALIMMLLASVASWRVVRREAGAQTSSSAIPIVSE
jgi:uncharacterized membrane protein